MNETPKKHIPLKDLEVYQLARDLSTKARDIYEKMSWQKQKIIGDQFISSIDSIGANIAEGYGRFHFLDKIKFYYNSRASMFEGVIHWIELPLERKLISEEVFQDMRSISERLSIKLNNFISTTYKAKKNKS